MVPESDSSIHRRAVFFFFFSSLTLWYPIARLSPKWWKWSVSPWSWRCVRSSPPGAENKHNFVLSYRISLRTNFEDLKLGRGNGSLSFRFLKIFKISSSNDRNDSSRNINRSIWFHVSMNYSPVREIDFRAWPKDRNVRNAFEETLSTLFIRRFHRGKKQIIDYRFRAGSIIGIPTRAKSWLLEVLRKADRFHALREAWTLSNECFSPASAFDEDAV